MVLLQHRLATFFFDPYMLLAAGVRLELIYIDDFASDALPMKFLLVLTLQKLIAADFDGTGNLGAIMVSLTFMRLRSCTVNATVLE